MEREMIKPRWFCSVPEDLQEKAKDLFTKSALMNKIVCEIDVNRDRNVVDVLWGAILFLVEEHEKRVTEAINKKKLEITTTGLLRPREGR